MDTTTSVTKFDIKNKKLYVKLIWRPTDNDLFHIKIFDGDVTWSGKFCNDSAKNFSDRCDETEKQYIRHVMRYLKGSAHNEVTYDFVYEENRDLAKFIWKKRLEDSKGFLTHGSVPVQRDTCVDSKDLLLDFLLEENRDLKTSIESLTKRNEDITEDLKKCKTELEQFVEIKNSLESSLYGKFVQLLNAKKRRIQVLERSLPKQNQTMMADNEFSNDDGDR